MPGPCATKPYQKHDAKPNRKSAKRLAARQSEVSASGYYPIGVKTGYFTKPGSQNRKK